ncbi:MAG TPA: hypothetical protein VFU76_06565 [Terriglobales bacterium]|nr:hypothetical protein [Terriglobales bacterium]
MSQFQPISSTAVSSPLRDTLNRVLRALRRSLLFWLEDEPATLLHMSRTPQPGVVICYECRCRVTQHELDAGLHNHAKAAAASGTHAQEQ